MRDRDESEIDELKILIRTQAMIIACMKGEKIWNIDNYEYSYILTNRIEILRHLADALNIMIALEEGESSSLKTEPKPEPKKIGLEDELEATVVYTGPEFSPEELAAIAAADEELADMSTGEVAADLAKPPAVDIVRPPVIGEDNGEE